MNRTTLETMIKRGLSTREIAVELSKSQTTVRYWIKKFDLAIMRPTHPSGPCTLCGKPARSAGSSLCGYCHGKVKRIRVKLAAIHYKGGKCQECGWDKVKRSLQFHHRDKDKKEFQISASTHNKSWDKLTVELDKCDLLCPSCHDERHTDSRPELMSLVYNYTGTNKFFIEALSISTPAVA